MMTLRCVSTRLHYHRGQGDGCIVIKSCDPLFFGGTGMMVEDLKQAGT